MAEAVDSIVVDGITAESMVLICGGDLLTAKHHVAGILLDLLLMDRATTEETAYMLGRMQAAYTLLRQSQGTTH